MIIEEIHIDGFRCLCDFKLTFEKDITLIVGENDSGKSSIIDCINLFTGDYHLVEDDFNHDNSTIKIVLKTPDFEFIKEFKNKQLPTETFKRKPTFSFLQRTKEYFNSLNDPIPEEDESKIKSIAKLFGLPVRSNSNVNNLKDLVSEKIGGDSEPIIENGSFPDLNLIQLNGKQFEDIEGFFKEVFLKDKQSEIWNENISDNKTIKEFIEDKLQEYSINI